VYGLAVLYGIPPFRFAPISAQPIFPVRLPVCREVSSPHLGTFPQVPNNRKEETVWLKGAKIEAGSKLEINISNAS